MRYKLLNIEIVVSIVKKYDLISCGSALQYHDSQKTFEKILDRNFKKGFLCSECTLQCFGYFY